MKSIINSKFKVQITRKNSPTTNGVVHAESRLEAAQMLNLPAGFHIVLLEEIPESQACFYDREFKIFLRGQ